MTILSVRNLSKRYKQFELKEVSFELKQGYIMGFIGRNGAGKTTTLKSMLNIVHADGGNVTMLGKEFKGNELQLKQKIGFMIGGVSYYPKQKLITITNVVRRFYDEWDDAVFGRYLKRFDLDPDKRVDQLSSGMQVKFALALALSHNAKLLILDEPTSGLDPVSRDDMLEVFQELIESGERSILYSTQIVSDLEKCADFITYLRNGQVVESDEKDAFLGRYKIVKGTKAQLTEKLRNTMIGYKEHSYGFSGLVKRAAIRDGIDLDVSPPNIESIMIYYEKEHKR
jgi:ABC-2 type transport system ATP-binding protein